MAKRHSLYIQSFFSIILAIGLLGCQDTPTSPSIDNFGDPGTGELGTFDASRYVALGNSITAGFLSGSLYESGQFYSYPAIIARQAHGNGEVGSGTSKFQMPLVAEPGSPGRIELAGYTSTGSPITSTNPNTTLTLKNSALSRPYNNLAIPGIVMADAWGAFTASNSFSRSALIDPVLRNPLLGNTSPVQQARAVLQPQTGNKLVTFWLGNNDVLGYATSGGVSPTAPTNVATFNFALDSALRVAKVDANTRIILGNIPDVTAIPFFTTISANFRTLLTINRIDSVVYQRGPGPGANPAMGTPTWLRTRDVGVRGLVLLTGGTAIQQVGSTARTFARGYWAGILRAAISNITTLPTNVQDSLILANLGINTGAPFGLSVSNPIPNQFILDDGELTIARTAVTNFNNAIRAQVPSRADGLVDVNALFNGIVGAGGIWSDGEFLKTALGSGGLFTMDGVHPSPKAHGVVANEFIKVINRLFTANIPLVRTRSIPDGIVRAGQGASIPTLTIGEESPIESFKNYNPETLKSTLEAVGGVQ
ncbi:MAG: SGNH/GDSL hydrolase family protein [Chloroherpetonaceae bacterium]|nr:SGNH/GDSL hydrolase family protein [Chloroherpetonaceae bacterium]